MQASKLRAMGYGLSRLPCDY